MVKILIGSAMGQIIECYKCGTQNEFGQRFCTNCGEKFLYRCPQCNAIIEHGLKSCSSCGVRFDWGELENEISGINVTTNDEIPDTESSSAKRLRTKTDKQIPWVAIFIAIVICIGAVFAVDTYFQNKASMNTPHKEQVGSIEAVGMQIASEELSGEYMSNEDMADAKYKGKVINVTGKITAINKNLVGTYFIKLSGGSIADIPVQCIFDKSLEEELELLEVNETITVKGTCDGMQAAVKLINCELADNS